ncbi:GNAT family N-acetyltransferase [Thaumasiovibrio subtropicus]|uniref:GNAT family N-acetyltransferase n=1 Tax=Thaumasiovibrio subtropicus TaxID=1891207 RepID=UPI000B34CEA2|nr:GNAT family N-acetyltransferase [Thaumasiovibrio subtropicus]
MKWQAYTFSQLNTEQLHALIKLRIDVFVVEQNCPYPELDGNDTREEVVHLLGYQAGKLTAYLRVLGAGITYETVSIGRVIIAPHGRGKQLGKPLMEQGIAVARSHFNPAVITIGAQHALIDFYRQFGFEACSEPYLEDDIPHIDMRLTLKKLE